MPWTRLFLLTVHIIWSGSVVGCTGQWDYFPLRSLNESSVYQDLSSVFVPDPEDKHYFQTIGVTQDKILIHCSEDQHCIQAHFLRALTALSENTELASHHFQKVVASEPNSQLAQNSRLWLWLLDEAKAGTDLQVTYSQVGKRLVRELIRREMRELEMLPQAFPLAIKDIQRKLSVQGHKIKKLSRQLASFNNNAASLHAVREELKSRDKKVAELNHQLEALRRIDQEIREKAQPTRPSDNIADPSKGG